MDVLKRSGVKKGSVKKEALNGIQMYNWFFGHCLAKCKVYFNVVAFVNLEFE